MRENKRECSVVFPTTLLRLKSMSARQSWTLTVAGWVLFMVSAIFFTVGAVRDGRVIELVASLSFLLACVLFMVPVILNRPHSG